MTFQEARAKLAQISGGKYRALYYEMIETAAGTCEVGCRVYVSDAKSVTRLYPTWQEAIEQHIRQQTTGANVPDVAEMPEGVTK